jgi:hypothetical protein
MSIIFVNVFSVLALFDAFAISLGLKEEPKFETLLDSVDFNGIIRYIKDKKATNIITMAGAGISTGKYCIVEH